MARKDPITSPAGRALYPKLTEPDTKFKDAGEYSVKLLLPEVDALPILNECLEIQKAAIEEEFERVQAEKPKMNPEKIREGIKLGNIPVKPHTDPESGEETGEYILTFKMVASGVSRKTGKPWARKPVIFDAKGKPIKNPSSIQIWSGSILKVAYITDPFSKPATGVGVTLRLEAVQIIKLVSGGQRDAAGYGFGEEEDGYSYQEEAEDGSPFVPAIDDEDTSGESDF